MRTNIYAEELTDRIEIISKTIDGNTFTGVRFYLELPTTITPEKAWELVGKKLWSSDNQAEFIEWWRSSLKENIQAQGPFLHHEGDDDSSAVTFWGKRDLRELLKKAIVLLDDHYLSRTVKWATAEPEPQPPTKVRHVFMVHCNPAGAVFVKTIEFYKQQGGFREPWGTAWRPIVAFDIEDARRTGCALIPGAKPYEEQAR
jgi:hypothetical protein